MGTSRDPARMWTETRHMIEIASRALRDAVPDERERADIFHRAGRCAASHMPLRLRACPPADMLYIISTVLQTIDALGTSSGVGANLEHIQTLTAQWVDLNLPYLNLHALEALGGVIEDAERALAARTPVDPGEIAFQSMYLSEEIGVPADVHGCPPADHAWLLIEALAGAAQRGMISARKAPALIQRLQEAVDAWMRDGRRPGDPLTEAAVVTLHPGWGICDVCGWTSPLSVFNIRSEGRTLTALCPFCQRGGAGYVLPCDRCGTPVTRETCVLIEEGPGETDGVGPCVDLFCKSCASREHPTGPTPRR